MSHRFGRNLVFHEGVGCLQGCHGLHQRAIETLKLIINILDPQGVDFHQARQSRLRQWAMAAEIQVHDGTWIPKVSFLPKWLR